MIKAAELRIGNRILANCIDEDLPKETIIKGVEVHLIHVELKPHIGIWIKPNAIEPIPLTPEWLDRCGFKDGKLNDFKIGYDNEDFVHSQMSVPFDGQLIKVKYLHQLQNLYYALIGEELTIKEQHEQY